jgi:hypothetical protein
MAMFPDAGLLEEELGRCVLGRGRESFLHLQNQKAESRKHDTQGELAERPEPHKECEQGIEGNVHDMIPVRCYRA